MRWPHFGTSSSTSWRWRPPIRQRYSSARTANGSPFPASAFEALKAVVEGMAHGKTMTLVPQGTELTTQQAADLLHVSRPYLVRLLDTNELPIIGSERIGA